MKDLRIPALLGAALLLVGAFLPAASLPLVGAVSFLVYGGPAAWFVLAMAALGGGLALAGQVRLVLWPGLGALAMLAFKFWKLWSGVDLLRDRAGSVRWDALRRLAETAADTVRIEWGWAAMGLGALVLVGAGLAARRRPAAFSAAGARDRDSQG